MGLDHRYLRCPFVAAVAVLVLTTGCGHRGAGPNAGRDGPRRDILDQDDVTVPISTMERFISNRLPGVVIRRLGGNPSIQIRGSSSFSSSNEARIVVDGREMSTAGFLMMSPSDVQRIRVLRGANAAIYGRRGANGVLVVTTR
jgi:TonB-dependent SusC/RagA subfamily outer membrane receptor